MIQAVLVAGDRGASRAVRGESKAFVPVAGLHVDGHGAIEERVLRVETERPLDDAAEHFHNVLADFMLAGGRITLALLGMGSDGHTCSLFTAEDLDRGAGRYALAVPRPHPPHRVSVTPNTLVHCERVVFVVSGEDKTEVARQLRESPDSLIAGQAVAGREEVELWQV